MLMPVILFEKVNSLCYCCVYIVCVFVCVCVCLCVHVCVCVCTKSLCYKLFVHV